MNKSKYKRDIIEAIESINPGITFRDAYPRVIELLAITIDSTIGELSEERNQAYRNNLQYLNNNQAVYHVMDLISEAITNNPFEDILGEVYMEKVSTKGTRETFLPFVFTESKSLAPLLETPTTDPTFLSPS